MNCEKAKELILSDAGSGENLEAHISSCAECRNLASAWSSLKDTRPDITAEPPGNLDFRIRGAAALFLDNRKIHHKVFVRRIFMYATAACCVFVTWLALDDIDRQSRTQGDIFVSSGTIPWSHIDMEKDFFELTAELELSIENIHAGGNADSENEVEVSIPDLST
ncbi:MAG: hypothetical protein NT118_01035 [Lentisphaerae bacterium]|nr:hypothetical protein [Lentisphaerota bacterium]